jgi:nucleotide-binding universal stress UspA family protein
MKTIIAPIDFSEASINALSFAAELAKRASAELTILNILEERAEEDKVKSKLDGIESDLKKAFGSDLRCKHLFVHGSFSSALKEVVDSHLPSLVVMGTKGASGLKRILIGSNTVNALSQIKVPVLVIPEVARFENFLRKGKNKVILATDLEAFKNDNAIDILKEIALLIIEPQVKVLNVRPKNTHLDFQASMERSALLSVFQPEIESERITVFSSNVMSGINFYLNQHEDTGLVAMIARDSGHLIQKHYTREMASHTQFPLLVLHDA